MRFARSFVVIALTVFSEAQGSEPHQLDVGTKKVSVFLDKKTEFTVDVTASKWRTNQFREPQLWGAWGMVPTRVISRITAKRGTEEIFVPFSSYGDLANPSSVAMRKSGGDVVLVIQGGTGGDSYRATLHFSNGKWLSKRMVQALPDSSGASEKTEYSVVEEIKR